MGFATSIRTRSIGRVVGIGLGRFAWAGGGVLLGASVALAGPEGASVAHGSATIASQGNHTTITAGHNAVIDYSSFNLGANESVQFIQPGASSRVLNRIMSADPSFIDGSVSANGIVYFANPAGIVFGPNSVIDAGAVYAAGGTITLDNFLSGTNRFTDVTGPVINHGSIEAKAAHLVGNYVANHGSIVVAPGGIVTMTAGEDVLIGPRGSRIMARLDASSLNQRREAAVVNTGTISARHGTASLVASDIYSVAIWQDHTGLIEAETISINATDGLASIAGTLDASDTSSGGFGGEITISGDLVGLFDSTIDASGDAGGGTVRIGGTIGGADGALPNASYTYVSEGTSIHADAITSGDGGSIVAWADHGTWFSGEATARGGNVSGDGGFIETSSPEFLWVQGAKVDASAPNGEAGEWLLDPTDITLSVAVTSAPGITVAGGMFSPDGTNPATANVNVGDIEAALEGGTDVTVTTAGAGPNAGTLDVNDAINPDLMAQVGDQQVTLTLISNSTMTIADTISAIVDGADMLSLDFQSGGDVVVQSAVTASGGGDVSILGDLVDIQAGVDAGAGIVGITADEVTFAASITGNGGITLAPRTPGTAINLNAGTAGLDVSEAELQQLESTGTVTIGDATAGAIGIANNGGGTDVDLSGESFSLTLEGASVSFNTQSSDGITLGTGERLTINTFSGGVSSSALGSNRDIIINNGELVINAQGGAVGATGADALQTEIRGLEVVTDTGGIFINDQVGNLDIRDLTGADNIGLQTGAGGAIELQAFNELTIDPNVQVNSPGSGDVDLTSLGVGNNAFGNITMGAGSLIDGGSGEITIDATDAQGNDADDGADIALAGVTTTSNSASAITITTDEGAISDNDGAGINLTTGASGGVVLNSLNNTFGDIASGDALETQTSTIDANTGAGGGINIDNTGGLAITLDAGGTATVVGSAGIDLGASDVGSLDVTANGGNITDSGLVEVAGTADFVTTQNNADVDLTSADIMGVTTFMTTGATGDASIVNTSNLEIGVTNVGGSLLLQAPDLTLTGPITAPGGLGLAPAAGTTIAINDASGTFSLTEADLQALNLTGTLVIGAADSGAVNIGSLGQIDLTGRMYDLSIIGSTITFNTGSNDGILIRPGGRLTLEAATGAIASNASGTFDVQAAELLIRSVDSVGTTGNPLQTEVGTLAVLVTGANGGIFVNENDLGLTIGSLTDGAGTVTGLTAGANGDIELTVPTDLMFASGADVTALGTGDVSLTATGGTVTMGDAIVNSGAGDIDVMADGDVEIGRLAANGNTNADAIEVTSTTGSIEDSGGLGGFDLTAGTGGGAILTAADVTNGSVGGSMQLTTNLSALEATASGGAGVGDVDVDNTGDLDAEVTAADSATIATTGTLTVSNAWSVDSFAITADDVSFSAAVAAASASTIDRFSSGTAGLGDGAGDFSLSGAELAQITTPELTVGGANITTLTLEALVSANSANIDRLVLDATDIAFTGASVQEVPDFDATASNGFSFAADSGVTSAGDLVFSAGAGGIMGSGDFTFGAFGTSGGTGLVTVTGNIVNPNAGVTITATDLDLTGATIDTTDPGGDGSVTLISTVSNLRLGDNPGVGDYHLTEAEFDAIMTGDLTIGDPNAGTNVDSLIMDNVVSLGAASGTTTLRAGGIGSTFEVATASALTSGDLSVIADNFTFTGTLSTGMGDMTFARGSAGTLGIGMGAGGTTVSNADLAQLTGDVVTFGGFSTASIDGITLAGTANIGTLGIATTGQATFENNTSETTGGLMVTSDGLTIDVASVTAGGLLSLDGGVTGSDSTGDLQLAFEDFDLGSTLTVGVGAADDLTLDASGGVFLGNVGGAGMGDAAISGADLGNILADDVTLNTPSGVIIDGVLPGESAGIGGLLTVNAMAGAAFVANDSSFGALTVNADTGISLANVTVLADGAMTLDSSGAGILLTGVGGTARLESTGDALITLDDIGGINAALEIASEGGIAGAMVTSTGDLTVAADTDGDGAETISFSGAVSGIDILLEGAGGGDMIDLDGDVVGDELIVRNARVDLAAGVDLTASNGSLRVRSGVTSIDLSDPGATTNVFTQQGAGELRLTDINAAGGDATVVAESDGDALLFGADLGSGSLTMRNGGGLELRGTYDTGGFIQDDPTGGGSAGDVTIANDVTINATGAAADVTFVGAIDGAQTLTVDAGRAVSVDGAIGGSTPLTGIDLSAGGAMTLGGDLSAGAGGVSLAMGGAFTLPDITTTGGGDVTVDNSALLRILNATSLSLSGSFSQVGTGPTNLALEIAPADDLSFAGPVTMLRDFDFVADSITFAGPVNSDATPRAVTLTSTAGDVSIGDFGATTAFDSLVVDAVGGVINIGGTVGTSGASQLYLDDVVITADTVLSDTGPSGITFTGNIDGDGTMPGHSLTILTSGVQNGDLSYPLALLGGDVGTSDPLRELSFGFSTGGGSVPAAATVVTGMVDGLGMFMPGVTRDATIIVTDLFAMSQNVKLTAFGDIDIDVTGGAGNASVSDITAFGDIGVDAASITIVTRPGGPILDVDSMPSETDRGVDFVAGGDIDFTVVPGASGGGFITFANPDGNGDVSGTLGGFPFQSFGDPIALSSLVTIAGSIPLDLASSGPTQTNVAESIAGAIPREEASGDVVEDTTVGQAQFEQLRELGVYPRLVTAGELNNFLQGLAVYNDFPDAEDPGFSAYRVAVPRLPAERVQELIDAADALFQRAVLDENGNPMFDEEGRPVREDLTGEVKRALNQAFANFVQSGGMTGQPDPVAFREYIDSTPGETEAREIVERYADLIRRLELLGLGPVETRNARDVVLLIAPPDAFRRAEQFELVLFPERAPVPTASGAEVGQ